MVSLLRQSPSTWRPSARYISIGAFLTLSKTLLAFIACFAVSDGPVLLAVRLVCPSPSLSSPLFRRLFPRTRMIIACFGRPVLSRFLAFFGLANLPVRGSFDPLVHLSISDVSFDTSGCLHLFIKTSKTDPFRRGVSLSIGASGKRICAVSAVAVTFRFEATLPGHCSCYPMALR